MDIPSFIARAPARLSRIIGAMALAVGVFALAACSALRLGYSNFDDIAYWWLDGYVDFRPAQGVQARDALSQLLRWHRKHELADLVSLLGDMQQAAPSDLSAAQACVFFTRLRDHAERVALQAEPAVVAFSRTLSPEQFAHMQHQFEKKNATWREDWIEPGPAQAANKRLDVFVQRSEWLYGSLDDKQKTVMKREFARTVFDASRVLAERQRRQQDLVQSLKGAAAAVSSEKAREIMRGHFDRFLHPPQAQARQFQQDLFDEGCRQFAALHNSTAPEQRAAAARRLGGWRDDLRELASAP